MAAPTILANGTSIDLDGEALTRRDGVSVPLRPQAFAVLRCLVGNANRLVSKGELMRAVWGATAVTDDSLVQAVGEIRRAIGDDGRDLLSTLPGRGYRLSLPTVAAAAPRATLAVLPLAAADPGHTAFAEALTLNVAAAASRSPDLRVLRGAPTEARYRLDGGLQRLGDRLRVTVALTAADTSANIWADTFDVRGSDAFDLQDRFTEAIVGAMLPAIRRAETERALRKPEAELDAGELLLRALPLAAANSPAATDRALALLRRALELEPGRHALHACAAWCREQRYLRSGFAPADREAALRHADVALAIDCADPDALGMAAFVRANITRDYPSALASIDRALTLNPLSVTLQGFAALVCAHGGYHDRAVAHAERALRLCPFDPLAYHPFCALALSHLVCGRPAEAVRFATLATRANPGFSVAHAYLAAAQANLGNAEGAAFAATRLVEIAPGFTIAGFVRMDLFRSEVTDLAAALRRAGLPE